MDADLYVVYENECDYDGEFIEIPIFTTGNKELAEMVSEKHNSCCEVRQYSDMTNLSQPCSMAFHNKMEHEKNKIIKELQEEIERKDDRIHSLNETVVRLTNIK